MEEISTRQLVIEEIMCNNHVEMNNTQFICTMDVLRNYEDLFM